MISGRKDVGGKPLKAIWRWWPIVIPLCLITVREVGSFSQLYPFTEMLLPKAVGPSNRNSMPQSDTMGPNTRFFLISWLFHVFCQSDENLIHTWKIKYIPTICYSLSLSWETATTVFTFCSVCTQESKADMCLEYSLMYFLVAFLMDLSVSMRRCSGLQCALEWIAPDW